MNFKVLLLCGTLALCVGKVTAQTLNWGNEFFGIVTDSTGNEVDNSFVFELGAFYDPLAPGDPKNFVPNGGNINDWYSHWEVFDDATYDADFDQFWNTVEIGDGVTSNSLSPNKSNISFAGLDAYIWIRKGDEPVIGSEWLLVRASNWTFPLVGGGCCNTQIIDWSTASDLGAGDVPLWGRQFEVIGSGVFTSNGSPSTLQTYTFIPEPGSALLVGIGMVSLVLRRSRSSARSLA